MEVRLGLRLGGNSTIPCLAKKGFAEFFLVGPPGFEPGTVRFPELEAMSLPLFQFFNLKKT